MGVFQGESVAGRFNEANFDIGQQGQHVAGHLGRHQCVMPCVQVQLRPGVSLQGCANIQLRQQFQAMAQLIAGGVGPRRRGEVETDPGLIGRVRSGPGGARGGGARGGPVRA